MDLNDALRSGTVAVDTAVFIHWIEDHPTMASVVAPIFLGVARGDFTICTSALTILEVLVVPYSSGTSSSRLHTKICSATPKVST